MMAECVLSVRHLRKTYRGREALRDLSFTLEAGDAAALVGPKGAGKTTLVRILAGLVLPEAGEVSLFGSRNERELRLARRQTGFLPDTGELYGFRSVEQNLGVTASLYGKPDPAYIRQLRREMGLTAKEQISRRLPLWRLPRAHWGDCALAAALVSRPRLLVLDEPLSGLDTKSIERLTAVLRRLREEGVTLLLTGEGPEELEPVCTRVLRLEAGMIEDNGSSREGIYWVRTIFPAG